MLFAYSRKAMRRVSEQYCTGDSEETSKTETVEGYPNKLAVRLYRFFMPPATRGDGIIVSQCRKKRLGSISLRLCPFRFLH
jgi:hypothetical protein